MIRLYIKMYLYNSHVTGESKPGKEQNIKAEEFVSNEGCALITFTTHITIHESFKLIIEEDNNPKK